MATKVDGSISPGDTVLSGTVTKHGTITASLSQNRKIKGLIPQPEDDENVLNLLAEFGYSTAVEDADGYVMTDVDDNIILG